MSERKPKSRRRPTTDLRDALSYDPATGIFRWRISFGRVVPGQVAGHRTSRGYITIDFDGRKYYSHRLGWYFVYGAWPIEQIDHINGDRSDNRIANLRTASNSENQRNTPKRRLGGTGYRGVWLHSGKFAAYITINTRRRFLGFFKTPELAAQAYNEAAREIAGEFAVLNSVPTNG